MQFQLMELVKLLGKTVEITERPLEGSEYFASDPAVGSMDDKISFIAGKLTAVAQISPTEIVFTVWRRSRANNEKPQDFIMRHDDNLFYELKIIDE
jgi:hypothetical protein